MPRRRRWFVLGWIGLALAAAACTRAAAPTGDVVGATGSSDPGASGAPEANGASSGRVASSELLRPTVVTSTKTDAVAYDVGAGASALSIDILPMGAIRWPKVRTPAGTLVTTGAPTGTMGASDIGWVSWKIPSPQAGRWTIAWSCGAAPCDPGRIATTHVRVAQVFESLYPLAPFEVDGDGLRVSLDASASRDLDGSLGKVRWAFGDGARAKGPYATHRYDAPGTYLITCVVIDDAGARQYAWSEVTVGSGRPSATPA